MAPLLVINVLGAGDRARARVRRREAGSRSGVTREARLIQLERVAFERLIPRTAPFRGEKEVQEVRDREGIAKGKRDERGEDGGVRRSGWVT